MQHLYFEGHNPSKGRLLLHGYFYAYTLEADHKYGMLPQSTRALKGWEKQIPSYCRDPLPWGAVCSMALNMIERKVPLVAAAMLLQFDLYARPAEILLLHKADLHEPDPAADKDSQEFTTIVIASRGIARLPKTMESDSIVRVGNKARDFLKDVVWILRRTVVDEGQLIFPFSIDTYVNELRISAERLGLADFKITARMMRYSGPAHDAWLGIRTPHEIRKRGHWATLSSVRRYEKHDKLLRILAKIPLSLKKQFRENEKAIEQGIMNALLEVVDEQYRPAIMALAERSSSRSQAPARSPKRRRR